MYPKTFSFVSLAVMVMMNMTLLAETSSTHPPFFNEAPSLSFDFEHCSAFGGIASANYSEFVPTSIVNPNCSSVSIVGNNLYRLNPQQNGHSCAPGFNSVTAMCIAGSSSCEYTPNAQQAIRVIVLVEPGPDGLGSLDNITFQSKSPANFQFITGETGLNNYPTRYAVRITNENKTVYESFDNLTTLDWTTKRQNLDGVDGLLVSEATYFLSLIHI